MTKPPPRIPDGAVVKFPVSEEWLGRPVPDIIDAANAVLFFAEETFVRARDERRFQDGKAPGEKADFEIDRFTRFQVASLAHAHQIISSLIGHEVEVRRLIRDRNRAEREAVLSKRAKKREDAR